MNNLRFEVIRYPFLDREESAPIVEVGREASVVVRGGRLWRSPIVKLGHQKADSIEVLPDMMGIIAKFECVLPEPGTSGVRLGPPAAAPDAPPVHRDLVVITSEGRTRSAMPVEVRPFTPRSGHANALAHAGSAGPGKGDPSAAVPGKPGASPLPAPTTGPTARGDADERPDQPCWAPPGVNRARPGGGTGN
jgi:hypothetical protein